MKTLHVLMCANDGYAMPLTVAAHSLMHHADPQARVELHVVTDGFSADNAARAERVLQAAHPGGRIVWHLRDETAFGGINLGRYSVAALFRLLLPELFPPEVDRVLYLDCDVVVERDVSELWDIDLGDRAIWAVQNGTDDDFVNYVHRKFPWIEAGPEARYFNSGVIMVNMAEWRRQQVSDRTLDFLQRHSDRLGFPDQDALNAVLAGHWGRLHPRWNKQILRMGQPEAARPDDPGILHYTTRKPWTPEYTQRAKWAWHRAFLRSGWEEGAAGWLRTARRFGAQTWHHNLRRVRGRVARLTRG